MVLWYQQVVEWELGGLVDSIWALGRPSVSILTPECLSPPLCLPPHVFRVLILRNQVASVVVLLVFVMVEVYFRIPRPRERCFPFSSLSERIRKPSGA